MLTAEARVFTVVVAVAAAAVGSSVCLMAARARGLIVAVVVVPLCLEWFLRSNSFLR